VDDPFDACFPGGLEESEGILHGIGVLEEAVVEPHPVGVVENRHAFQLLGQDFRLVEMERERFDPVAKGIRSGQGVGQGNDRVSIIEKPLGDVLP
jgi:hypothetical protein